MKPSSIRILSLGPLQLQVRIRAFLMTLAILILALLVGIIALTQGDLPISIPDVLAALTGHGNQFTITVVTRWRLPRIVAALVLGAALGAAGAIFQSLTRNPLGSPDVIGFSTGAYTGALLVMLVAGGGWIAASAGAFVGGIITAAVIYLLARRGSSGLRIVLVGIGVSAMLSATNHWLLLRAELDAAMAAAIFGAGSLNGVKWPIVILSGTVTLVLLILALACQRILATLELGDDLAAGLGLPVVRWRGILVVLGVALIACVVTVTGPIAFVALVSAHIARRLTGVPGVDVAGAAATGALLLTTADFLAQRCFAPIQLPVGIVTGVIGGCYLGWLLFKETRR